MKRISGFTLIEVLIATTILTVAILSTLSLLSSSMPFMGQDPAIFQNEAQRLMEEICAFDYRTIRNTWTNNGNLRATVMNITNNNDRSGTIYVNELPQAAFGLMRIKVVVCYRQKNHAAGEDRNFNGILDAGEDTNLNGELDSPCELETVVANREF